MKCTWVNSTYNYSNITSTGLFSIPFMYRCYWLKEIKLNKIEKENKNKIIGSLRYHVGDEHKKVT